MGDAPNPWVKDLAKGCLALLNEVERLKSGGSLAGEILKQNGDHIQTLETAHKELLEALERIYLSRWVYEECRQEIEAIWDKYQGEALKTNE